jgi:hypothetical protein
MSLLIAILIVYGITLIIVQSHIFQGFRNYFKVRLDRATTILKADENDVPSLFANHSSVFILSSDLAIYDELIKNIHNFDSSHPEFIRSASQIQELIKSYTPKWFKIVRFTVERIQWFFAKADKFVNCMMCVGFWVGMGLTILSLCNSVVLFAQPLVIIDGTGTLFSVVVSLILISFMFSGTTWAINAIVDYFDEQKSK